MSKPLAYNEKNLIPGLLDLATLPVSSYVTDGLAQIFDFKVLRHGTSWINYLGILKNGANPDLGGMRGGSGLVDPNFIKGCKQRFHVFKDKNYFCRVLPRLHAVLAGLGHAQSLDSKIIKIAASIFLGVTSFFTPTLRFIYREKEIEGSTDSRKKIKPLFKNDPYYSGLAYKTKYALSSGRIGLIGICNQASFADFKRACSSNPQQVLKGLALVATGVALTAIGAGIVF